MRIKSSQQRTTRLIQVEFQATAAGQLSLFKWNMSELEKYKRKNTQFSTMPL